MSAAEAVSASPAPGREPAPVVEDLHVHYDTNAGPGGPGIGVVMDVQVLDDQHRLPAGGGRRGGFLGRAHVRFASRGLANRSKPTEVRKRPRRIAAIMTIGGAHHHQ